MVIETRQPVGVKGKSRKIKKIVTAILGPVDNGLPLADASCGYFRVIGGDMKASLLARRYQG
jgi:hypothetical protein